MLKANKSFKSTGFFARNFPTDCLFGFLELIAQERKLMYECSKSNNIERVNGYVKSFLGLPEFWVLTYESIKSNPGVYCFGDSAFIFK